MAGDDDSPGPLDAALLQESAEELYEDAPCGYLSTLPDGTIVRLNRTFEQWTGHSREALLGSRRLQDLLTAGGRIYHETHYAPLLQMQGRVREIAVEIVCADGRRLPVLLNSVLRRDADGTARVVRTTVFDASDRRRYERELLAARRRAERLQAHTALLAETGRELDETPSLRERVQRLADLLAPGFADHATVVVGDDLAGQAGEAPPAGGAELRVPLRARGSVLGDLAVARRAERGGFEPGDAEVVQDVADRAALALENARLYEQERNVARRLQESMLAGEIPSDPRCAIGTHYAPAVDTLQVGGDWYDAFWVDAGRVAIVVGDVVGRGLDAAAAMGQLRSAVRALAGARLGPAGVLEHLDAFVEHTEVARGATVAYAEIELAAGTMTFACAGHPPPVLLEPGDAPRLLWGGRSTPLGAFAGSAAARTQEELALPRGARLLLYTDGLVERRDQPIDDGIERLMEAFDRRRGTPVTALGEALTVDLLGDRHGDDDVCLLCLALGFPDGFEHTLPADARRLAALRADLRAWLESSGVGEDDREALVLACSEAAANAIEHGYRGTSGEVLVVAAAAAGEVTLTVHDDGTWRARGASGARGRGLAIVEHLVDEVALERHGGTTVTMRRRLRKDAA